MDHESIPRQWDASADLIEVTRALGVQVLAVDIDQRFLDGHDAVRFVSLVVRRLVGGALQGVDHRAGKQALVALRQRVGRNAYDVHLPLARHYLKVGWTADALRELGFHADNITAAGADPRMRTRRGEPTVDEFPRLGRLLLEMPAAERYSALKTWSLPTAGRKSIRYFVGSHEDRPGGRERSVREETVGRARVSRVSVAAFAPGEPP